MKLTEAIEILDRITAQDEESGRPECVEAEKLGSEALKRCQLARKETSFVGPGPLPGETFD